MNRQEKEKLLYKDLMRVSGLSKPIIKEPEFENTLLISIEHFPYRDIKVIELDHKNYPQTVIEREKKGFFLRVTDGDVERTDYSKFSNAFVNVVNEAKRLGCTWLLIDCDGPTYPELPIFEWNLYHFQKKLYYLHNFKVGDEVEYMGVYPSYKYPRGVKEGDIKITITNIHKANGDFWINEYACDGEEFVNFKKVGE